MVNVDKEYLAFMMQHIEMRYRLDGQYYLDRANVICNDARDIKIDLRLSPATDYIKNPQKLVDELIMINGWLFQLYNHHGFVNPEIIEVLDRLITRLGYIGKFKSQMVSSRYANDLYLIHKGQLVTISID